MPKPTSKPTSKKTSSAGRNGGTGSNYTWNQSVLNPKNASPNKYGTIATPKSKPNSRPSGVSGASEVKSTAKASTAKSNARFSRAKREAMGASATSSRRRTRTVK